MRCEVWGAWRPTQTPAKASRRHPVPPVLHWPPSTTGQGRPPLGPGVHRGLRPPAVLFLLPAHTVSAALTGGASSSERSARRQGPSWPHARHPLSRLRAGDSPPLWDGVRWHPPLGRRPAGGQAACSGPAQDTQQGPCLSPVGLLLSFPCHLESHASWEVEECSLPPHPGASWPRCDPQWAVAASWSPSGLPAHSWCTINASWRKASRGGPWRPHVPQQASARSHRPRRVVQASQPGVHLLAPGLACRQTQLAS